MAWVLSSGGVTESTAEDLQSMAQPRKGPMLCRHCHRGRNCSENATEPNYAKTKLCAMIFMCWKHSAEAG